MTDPTRSWHEPIVTPLEHGAVNVGVFSDDSTSFPACEGFGGAEAKDLSVSESTEREAVMP
jgi:hypothetical protein